MYNCMLMVLFKYMYIQSYMCTSGVFELKNECNSFFFPYPYPMYLNHITLTVSLQSPLPLMIPEHLKYPTDSS